MKKSILLYISAAIIASAFIVASVKATSTTSCLKTEEECTVNQQITSPYIPDNIEFCGQSINLLLTGNREQFDREITAFTYGHSTTLLIFKRANRYFPIIEKILKEEEVPDDFKYLAVVETMLNIRAVSSAKAAGLWQFMEGTAKDYGLEVTSEVDQRYDIELSTRAACKYFKKAYEDFGDWSTVAAAYNAGKNRLNNDLEKQQGENFFDLWLPEETMRYVFRILAIKQIMTHPKTYGFILKEEDFSPSIQESIIEINTPINWVELAQKYGLTYAQLRASNVWIRDLTLTNRMNKTYRVNIPNKADFKYDCARIKVHDSNWIK